MLTAVQERRGGALVGKLCGVLLSDHSYDERAVQDVDGLEDGCCSPCHCQAYQLGRPACVCTSVIVLLSKGSLFWAHLSGCKHSTLLQKAGTFCYLITTLGGLLQLYLVTSMVLLLASNLGCIVLGSVPQWQSTLLDSQ